MADHPLQPRPFLVVPFDPEQVDVPVEVVLEVLRPHPREPSEVALDPGAQAVDHLHALQVGGVAGVRLVRLVGASHGLDQGAVRLLPVVDYRRAGGDVGQQGVPHPLGGRLAVAAGYRDHVLARVDGHGDAELVAGEAPPGPPVGVAHERGVGDVDLVDPDAAREPDRVLPALHRREDPVAPLEGGPVGDAAQLRRRVQLAVPAHHRDEPHPRGEVRLRALEHRPGERPVPQAARPAQPPLRPGRGPAVADRPSAPAAARAPRGGPECLGRLLEGAPAVGVPAGPGLDRGRQQGEVVGAERGDAPGVGVAPHIRFPSARADVPPGCRQT